MNQERHEHNLTFLFDPKTLERKLKAKTPTAPEQVRPLTATHELLFHAVQWAQEHGARRLAEGAWSDTGGKQFMAKLFSRRIIPASRELDAEKLKPLLALTEKR